MEGLYLRYPTEYGVAAPDEIKEIDEDLMNMILEESVLELSLLDNERRNLEDEEVSQIRKNYEDALRRSIENPDLIYAPNIYEDSDLEEWDDTSDLEE